MAQEYSFLMKDLQASLEEVGLLCNECTCILLLDCLIGYLVEVGPWSGGGAVSEGGAGGGEGTAEGEGSSCFQNFIKLNAISPTSFLQCCLHCVTLSLQQLILWVWLKSCEHIKSAHTFCA